MKTTPPRGYSLMQHRVTGALLRAAEEQDMPLTVRQVEILASAAVKAARVELGPDRPRRACAYGVSDQQRRILIGVANGLSTKQLAERLNVTENTLKVHIRLLNERIGASDRASAVAIGFKLGLIGIDDIVTELHAHGEAA
ncbi:hypothetical protein GCM10010193_69450 [Kitasatospora atroaurantiaca]|uniref:Regulatory LuxR family protein n=1 Tax=Kitasatospora atroaurantiaca TaxID=285545 RepID=A0A561EN74_9ACTN|nr:LuxR C-terminal-related transcriptional regulator [Kitasatospora atroaurantiaca]TWE17032.1 regulatory LuxR family protein [Kitasatospora atroaurantiaca]